MIDMGGGGCGSRCSELFCIFGGERMEMGQFAYWGVNFVSASCTVNVRRWPAQYIRKEPAMRSVINKHCAVL